MTHNKIGVHSKTRYKSKILNNFARNALSIYQSKYFLWRFIGSKIAFDSTIQKCRGRRDIISRFFTSASPWTRTHDIPILKIYWSIKNGMNFSKWTWFWLDLDNSTISIIHRIIISNLLTIVKFLPIIDNFSLGWF